MPTIIKGQPTSAEVRATLAAEGRPVLVAFSTGKDALACELALQDAGIDTRAHPRVRGDVTCRLGQESSLNGRLHHFPALRSLLARLQPARMVGFCPPSSGLRMSVIPSKSIGCQSCRWTRKSNPWSPLREKTMSARPSLLISTIRVHISSLTRAETLPQNTPGAISRSHRVRKPRRPTGQAVSTTTTTAVPHSSGQKRGFLASPTVRQCRPDSRCQTRHESPRADGRRECSVP